MTGPLRKISLPIFALCLLVVTGRSSAQPPVQPAPADAGPPLITDPTVRALLDANPQTPEEMVRAASILADLDHAPLAKPLLEKLMQENLDDAALTQLHDQFGGAALMKLARNPALQPEAEQFATKVLEATDRHLKDPARLAEYVSQLQDPSETARAAAVAGLRRAGEAGVNALLAVLANPDRAGEHQSVRAALIRQGSNAVDPLIGALDAQDPALRTHVMYVLGSLGAKDALPYVLGSAVSDQVDPQERAMAQAVVKRLLGAVPSKQEAVAFLLDRTKRNYDGLQKQPTSFEGQVSLWTWDPMTSQAVQRAYPADIAAVVTAGRLAREVLPLEPEDPQVRQLYLAALLEAATYQHGLATALPTGEGTAYEVASKFSPEDMKAVLAQSMADGHLPAATSAARMLGDMVTVDELYSRGAQPSVLAQAAAHPNRRLRYAAVESILELQPTKPYPGSSHVAQALAFFAGTTGPPRVLVADRHLGEAARMAGMLAEFGFEADIANGRTSFLRKALSSPDYAFVLIDAELPNTDVDRLIQTLRRDMRTGTLPVGIISPLEEFTETQRIARQNALTTVFVRPQSREGFAMQMDELLATAGRHFVPHEERMMQAGQSLEWIAALTQQPQTLYDLRQYDKALESTMYVPSMVPAAAEVMANFGTPLAQQTLVNVASLNPLPLETRQAAAAAFDKAVQRYDIQLTTDEILRQYDRYNQSESLDKETQAVLGAILDTLESRLPKEEEQAAAQGN